ncbi:MAG TPA: HNH endonuclease signature motif containing protein [Actinomycetota bacterium]|nr:HNH endonuclease signature motif containing protein [Actinomycetota bacterium]
MRRALVIRDGRCKFPGCARPHGWWDAHHALPWSRGGPTALSNLVLLCRLHHRLVHSGRFRLKMDDGVPAFARTDGSILEDRAPP